MKKPDERKTKEKQIRDPISLEYDRIVINKEPSKILICYSIKENDTLKSCCGVELTLSPSSINEIGEKIARNLESLMEEAESKRRNNINDTHPMTA